MRGMILAAGLGTRLRPLSYELPKPAIPVLGRPLCTYNMEFLFRSGIRSFVMNLHRHPKLIQQKVAGWAGKKVPVEYTVEPQILGTGGGIRNARSLLRKGTFVTANGDTVVRFSFPDALAFHRRMGSLGTLVLFPDPAGRYTPVRIDANGRLTGIGVGSPGGERSGFYTGFQILEPEILELIPPGKPSCIIRETYEPLIRKNAPVFGYLAEGVFREFGTPSDYLDGTLAILAEKSVEGTLAQPEAKCASLIHPVYVGPGALLSPGATIGPGAVVEEGAKVGDGASVSEAILWPGASLPAGERLTRGILTTRRKVEIPAR